MQIALQDILTSQGKTIYWLSKQTGITQQALAKLAKNDTDRITFDNLEKICRALNAMPNDFFILD